MWYGISVYAQPIPITEVPSASTNFHNIGAPLFILLRMIHCAGLIGSAGGTVFLKSGFNSQASFYEFNGMLFLTEEAESATSGGKRKKLWRSDGTPSGTILLKTSSAYDVAILTKTSAHRYFTFPPVAFPVTG